MKINTFFLGIIGILIIIIIIMRTCSAPPVDNKPKIIITKTDTVYKTVIKEKPVYTPVYVKIPVEVPTKVDTAEILKDYFAKRVYKDKIKLDSLEGYVFVEDTISQNMIINRKVSFDYKIPIITKTITNTITLPPKRQLFGGFELQASQGLVIFSGALDYKDKRDQIYKIGLGYTSQGYPIFKIGTSWKIKIK